MKNKRKTWVGIACALGICAVRVDACTLWGATVTNGAGGTIVCKNRDWAPDHTQVLKAVRPAQGYAYYGLFAAGGAEPGIKAGVNEKGLVVVTASASCLPKDRRDHQPGKHGVLTRLLTECADCSEVLAKKDALFPRARASFVLMSDRVKLVTVEVGLDGKYAVKSVEAGHAAHTNHYLEPELAALNELPAGGSRIRLDRALALLNASPVTVDAFAAISRDRHDGPNNSLWRTGKKVRTLASWIVAVPAEGAPAVRVVLAAPNAPEETRTVVLDAAFWRGACGREENGEEKE